MEEIQHNAGRSAGLASHPYPMSSMYRHPIIMQPSSCSPERWVEFWIKSIFLMLESSSEYFLFIFLYRFSHVEITRRFVAAMER